MIAFIHIISFLLHIIALAAIFQLQKQLKRIKQTSTDDVTELFETYLQEIKEENRLLEEKLVHHDRVEPTKDTPQTSLESNDAVLKVESESGVSIETSQKARILQLHDQGLPNEKIASKLNCGKTEVALMIKLHGKTDNNT